MSFDGIVTRCVVAQLNREISGGKINKINQPNDHEVVLNIYSNRQNKLLLLSASSNVPRIHLTQFKAVNPPPAPNFCMILRKHLQSATIKAVEQLEMDRVVRLRFTGRDEMGFPVEKTLILEIMGKHSNLILVDHTEKIIDSIKRVGFDMSRVRQIYPGLQYHSVASEKHSVLEETPSLLALIEEISPAMKTFQVFYTHFTGLSPIFGREVCYRAGVEPNRPFGSLEEQERIALDENFQSLVKEIRELSFTPAVYYDLQGKVRSFYCLPLTSAGDRLQHFADMSQALDFFYAQNDNDDRLSQKAASLKKKVSAKLVKAKRKVERMEADRAEEEKIELFRLYGDLLASNVHKMNKGMEKIELENFFDENRLIEIPLDPRKTPWENAQRYYKRSSKLKTAQKLLDSQLPRARSEVDYLLQVQETISQVTTLSELTEIAEELRREKILPRSREGKKGTKKEAASAPLQFRSSEGLSIYVGKNNRQNDRLTMKMANKNDLFFHAKNIPGSHVILRTDLPYTEKSIEEAAFLAALHSSGKKDPFVEVDWTEKKNVRKPKGARPGMVTYDHYKTAVVDTGQKKEIEKI